MTNFAFSSLFAASMVGAAFDVTIQRDADNGRVSALLSETLASAYGLQLPASPAMAVKYVNEFITLEKAPRLAAGPGARAAAPAVAQALHALGAALASGGRVAKLPALAALAPWADPVAIAASKAAASTKRAATVAAKTAPAAAAAAPAATMVAPAAAAAAPATGPDVAAAVVVVLAAARGGHLSAKQLASLRAALDTAAAAPASVPTKHKGGKATVSAPAAAAAAAAPASPAIH